LLDNFLPEVPCKNPLAFVNDASEGLSDYQMANLEAITLVRACNEENKRGIDEPILPRPYYVTVTIPGMV